MANTDAPFGFRPVKMLDGSPYNGATIRCAILAADGTATFIGDPVKLSGTASADGTAPSVAQAAVTDEVYGVIVGFEPDESDLTAKHRAASTLRYCQVVPALDVVFAIQCDGAFAITDVGNTADFIVAAGDTDSGISAVELDSSDIGTGANLQILGLSAEPDNEVNTNANVLVRINESGFRGDGTAA